MPGNDCGRVHRCPAVSEAPHLTQGARAGDSEAVLDGGGEPVVLAEAALHKPDDARELKRITSKVHLTKREAYAITLRWDGIDCNDLRDTNCEACTSGHSYCLLSNGVGTVHSMVRMKTSGHVTLRRAAKLTGVSSVSSRRRVMAR